MKFLWRIAKSQFEEVSNFLLSAGEVNIFSALTRQSLVIESMNVEFAGTIIVFYK